MNNTQPPSIWKQPIRPHDQTFVAAVLFACLLCMVGYWLVHGGLSGGVIDIDKAELLPLQYRVDVNTAKWTELIVLPGIGETLARRIVENREKHGVFHSADDIQRVHGMGPKSVDRIRPFLAPMDGPG